MTVPNNVCANCHSSMLVERFPESDNIKLSENNSNIYKCSSMGHVIKPQIVKCIACGLVQIPLSKQPIDLVDMYGDVVDQDYIDNIRIKKRTFENAYKKIEPFIGRPGRLLEIGCYCGLFINLAQQKGWECVGVEPSKWAAELAASKNKNCEIINLEFESALSKIQRKFDLIVSWDVIEHVRDPNEMLRSSSQLLNSGGVFAFSTIDISSWFPRIMGRKWPWIMQMHLYYFDVSIIKNMLNKHGYELIHVSNYVHYASLRYIFKKLLYLLPDSFINVALATTSWVPEIVIPVSLGDVKLFIARKK